MNIQLRLLALSIYICSTIMGSSDSSKSIFRAFREHQIETNREQTSTAARKRTRNAQSSSLSRCSPDHDSDDCNTDNQPPTPPSTTISALLASPQRSNAHNHIRDHHYLIEKVLQYEDFTSLCRLMNICSKWRAAISQVVLPTCNISNRFGQRSVGQQWATRVNKVFDTINNEKQSFNAGMKDIVGMIARCKNPIQALSIIYGDYFNDIPQEQRFWSRHGSSLITNQQLELHRLELASIYDKKAVLEKQLSRQEGQQSHLREELKSCLYRYNELVNALLPCAKALIPYYLAHLIRASLVSFHQIFDFKMDVSSDDGLLLWLMRKENEIIDCAIFEQCAVIEHTVISLLPTIQASLASLLYSPFSPCTHAEKAQIEDHLNRVKSIFKREYIFETAHSKLLYLDQSPLTFKTFEHENLYIDRLKQQIQQMVKAMQTVSRRAASRNSAHHELARALGQAQGYFSKFLCERAARYLSTNTAALAPYMQPRVIARPAELLEIGLHGGCDVTNLYHDFAKLYFSASQQRTDTHEAVSHLQQAISYAQIALARAVKYGEPHTATLEQLGSWYKLLAFTYKQEPMTNLERAASCLEKAADINENISSYELVAHIHLKLANGVETPDQLKVHADAIMAALSKAQILFQERQALLNDAQAKKFRDKAKELAKKFPDFKPVAASAASYLQAMRQQLALLDHTNTPQETPSDPSQQDQRLPATCPPFDNKK